MLSGFLFTIYYVLKSKHTEKNANFPLYCLTFISWFWFFFGYRVWLNSRKSANPIFIHFNVAGNIFHDISFK